MSGTPKPLCNGGVWVTERWLFDNGFQLQSRRDRQPTDHFRRDIGGELLGGRPFMSASDDLCIEVARDAGTHWFCWLVQIEPCRHIHLRMITHTWELQSLFEGLTGREWSPGNGGRVDGRQ